MIKRCETVKGYKFRLHPTKSQEEFLNRVFGACRYVYNELLAQTKKEFEEYRTVKQLDPASSIQRPNVSGFSLALRVKDLRANLDTAWLQDVSATSLKIAAFQLGTAYQNFFRRLKQGQTPGFPRFKKKTGKQAFTLDHTRFVLDGDNRFCIEKYRDSPIAVKFSRSLPSPPRQLTISREPTGKYFVSFLCEYAPDRQAGSGATGIDLGLTSFVTLADGTKVVYPKYLTKSLSAIRRIDKSIARKRKGLPKNAPRSGKLKKAYRRRALVYEKLANRRKDFQHKLSSKLISENQVLGIESLKVTNMVRNRKLARHISDASWSSFVSMLKYKAREAGVYIHEAHEYYPSSHICSLTGKKLERKLALRERTWNCPYCHQVHDRDTNAAVNLMNLAVSHWNGMFSQARQ
jgi:putative transposase